MIYSNTWFIRSLPFLEHLTTEQEKAGTLGLPDASFSAVYSLAERRSIVGRETLSNRSSLEENDVEEACEGAKMDFDSGKHLK